MSQSRRVVGVLVLGCAFAVAGCRESASTAPEVDVAVAVDAAAASGAYGQPHELLADLEGVWSTTDAVGDDAETVYALRREGNDLRVFVDDNVELVSRVDDVDLDNASVALRVERDGPVEVLTLQRLNVGSTRSEGIGLRLTYGNGQTDELRFVRRLSGADLEMIRGIRERDTATAKATARLVAAGIDCERPVGFRAKTVCADFYVRQTQEVLAETFDRLAIDYPDDIPKTEAAAWRQLDACTSRACLDAGYESWTKYLDANYETELMVD